MNKKKPVIVEFRYAGKIEFFDRNWVRWNSYRDEKTAEEAMTALRRNWKSWEFRIKGKK